MRASRSVPPGGMVRRYLPDRWSGTNYIEGAKEMDWPATWRHLGPGAAPHSRATHYHPPVTPIRASTLAESASLASSSVPWPREISAAVARRFLVLRHLLAPP